MFEKLKAKLRNWAIPDQSVIMLPRNPVTEAVAQGLSNLETVPPIIDTPPVGTIAKAVTDAVGKDLSSLLVNTSDSVTLLYHTKATVLQYPCSGTVSPYDARDKMEAQMNKSLSAVSGLSATACVTEFAAGTTESIPVGILGMIPAIRSEAKVEIAIGLA